MATVRDMFNQSRAASLLNQYCSTLGDAVLRHRASLAEHSARVEAELANKVKSEFIANMSHELKTPLNTVMGFSKLIAEQSGKGLSTKDTVEYAVLIHDAAQHLLAIINDILDISKIQAGKFVLDVRDVALDEVAHAVVASFKLMALDAGVKLSLDVAPTVPLLPGDAVKIRQIFTNLISNAIKFTPVDGTVAVAIRDQPDGTIVASVTDTGIGMTADEIAVALTPFGQVDSSRTRWREGTGLGLPIARSLVEMHGGKFEILSEKNVGTEVRMIFRSNGTAAAPDVRSTHQGDLQ